jgi:hypothetical protein
MKRPDPKARVTIEDRLRDSWNLLNLAMMALDSERQSKLDDEDLFAINRAVEMAHDNLLDIWNTTPRELLEFAPAEKGKVVL